MKRLLGHVEGETEETFVNDILAPHLTSLDYVSVSARIVGNARQRDRRGGIRAWESVRNDIIRHLKQDTGAIATTFIDYYGLPQIGNRAWPGRADAGHLPFAQKASTVEMALKADIQATLGKGFNINRFVPFVMMHEFEALLFSDCNAFANSMGRPKIASALQAIRAQFATPEEINESPISAPSKRVEAIIPDYNKPLFGNIAILEIGLDAIRRECPHFHQWLTILESHSG